MQQERGQWSGRLGFILAAAGSAIGLGNLWKFPYVTHQNEGGAFVLIYIAAVVLVGFPIMAAEVIVGRRARRSPVGAFLKLGTDRPGGRLWAGLGFLGVTAGFIILSYYSVVAGWTLHYVLMSIQGELAVLARDATALQDHFLNEFLASGPKQIGYHLVFMAATVSAVFFGVKKGIERVAKVLMPLLFAIILFLVIYSTTTSGFGDAMRFLFRPNFGDLEASSILEAVGQAFFSLSLGMGAMLTYGSYMQRKSSIPRSVTEICILDSMMGILACVIMFSIIFTFDLEITQSATILFTTLPTVLVQLPLGSIVLGLFFVLVAFAALTSTVSLMEVVSSYAIDELGWNRRFATVAMGVVIGAFGILSALSLGASETLSRLNLFGKDSTVGLFSSFDYLAANWLLPVGGLLVAIFVGWIMAARDIEDELAEGHGRLGWIGPLIRQSLRYVAPLAVGAILFSIIFLGAEYQ
ncbi:sodium-dependent transporter [bacterium]|nr:sodium-dependent transporter [bacterium]